MEMEVAFWFFIVQLVLAAVHFVLNFYVYKLEFPHEKFDLNLLETYAYVLTPVPFIGAVTILILFILLLLKIKWQKQQQQRQQGQ